MIGRYALLVAAGSLVGSIQLLRYPLCLRKKGWPVNLATSNVAPRDLYRRSGTARKAAGLAFLFELLKGFLPTFTAYLALSTPGTGGGRSAVLVGNYFTHFVRLRGSNSLAPLLRVLLAVYAIGAVKLGMTWTAAWPAWRYAPLAALVTATTGPPPALASLEAKEPYEKTLVLAPVFWSILFFFARREDVRRPISRREVRAGASIRGEDTRGRSRVS